MGELSSIFPATVIAAIVIFLIKELLEGFRKRGERYRKLVALRRMLIDECERNKFAIGWFKGACRDIEQALEDGHRILIRDVSNGMKRLTFQHDEGESSSPIPKLYARTLHSYHFEAASIDKATFEAMTRAIGAVEELEHLTAGLLEHVCDDQCMLGGWADYAQRNLDFIQEPLQELYKVCGGRGELEPRLRALA